MYEVTDKPILFQQQSAGNCGLYSIANLFNDADFVADLTPGVGQDTFELNRLFRAKRQDVYLTTDYLVPMGFGQMTDHTCFSPDDPWTQEGGCMVYVFIVATGKYLHAIGVLMRGTPERELFVVDSLRRHVIQTTAGEFLKQYTVQGLLNFRLDQGPAEQGACACWDESFFAHILPCLQN
jgi:hypothetical protein